MTVLAEPRPDIERARIITGLDRIYKILGMAAASLGGLGSLGSMPDFRTGKNFALTGAAADMEHRARASQTPLVVPDTAAHETLAHDTPSFGDGTPIRFLAILPMGSGARALTQLLILVDRVPRNIGTANRLAMTAIEAFSGKDNDAAGHAAMSRLQHNLELIDKATAGAGMGVWQCHLAGDTLTWGAGVFDIFGLARTAPLRRDRIIAQYSDSSRAEIEEARARATETGTEFGLDAKISRPDGQERWIRLTGSVQRCNGLSLRLFGTKRDITQERTLIDSLRHTAETDAMTGLANRGSLQARLDEPEGIAALLLIDLDGFKAVNDTYGHAIGDTCLREAARRLRACCTETRLVSRLGGDEFAVVLDGGHGHREADALARKIVECMQVPFDHAGMRIELGASVGLAFRFDGSGDELFSQADQALYLAKAAGRRTSRTFKNASFIQRNHSA